MLKKTIQYHDLDDNLQQEEFYFNFSVQELVDMQLEVEGGMQAKLEQIAASGNVAAMMGTMKDVVLRAIGKKSPDGKRFEKNEQIREDFYNSPAYGVLFMELITNAGAASAFMNALMPKDLRERVAQVQQATETPGVSVLDRHPEHYTLQERVDMSEAEFDKLYGTNPKKWSKETLVAAMRRHTTNGQEEVKS